MSPEDALQMLDRLAAQAAMNRNDHVQLQTAISVLDAAIKRLRAFEHPKGED
jgi:hypothetical protein